MTEKKRAARPEHDTPPEVPPSVRRGYEAAREPEPQGDGDPGTEPAPDPGTEPGTDPAAATSDGPGAPPRGGDRAR